MTLWDLVTATVRRWPILLAGAVLTAVIAYAAVSDDGVYYTRTELVLLAPSSTDYPNTLKTKSGSLVVTAGLLAKRMMGPGEPAKYASPDVTLIGEGIREGWSRRRVREYVFEHARIEADALMAAGVHLEHGAQHDMTAAADGKIDTLRSPDDVLLVTAGGEGAGWSAWLPAWAPTIHAYRATRRVRPAGEPLPECGPDGCIVPWMR